MRDEEEETPATRGDLGRLENNLRRDLASKDDLAREVAKLATKDDLSTLEARFDEKLATKDDLSTLAARFDEKLAAAHAGLLAELRKDLALHSNANAESLRGEFRVIDDKYNDRIA